MILKSRHIALVVLVFFAGGVGLSIAVNQWRTESSKIPAAYSSGEFAGQPNPADIRGSYSLADIESAFGVRATDLAAAFGVSADENPASFKVKQLEGMYGATEGGEIGTDSVRYFVALYKGLPYEPEDTTILPRAAGSVLRERLSGDELAALSERMVRLAGPLTSQESDGDPEPAENATSGEHSETEEAFVKGRTTFQELLDWGLTREEIEGVLGFEMGKSGVTVRDHVVANGLEFKGIREQLQALLDAKRGV